MFQIWTEFCPVCMMLAGMLLDLNILNNTAHVSEMNRILPCVYDASRHVTWSQYLKQHCPCLEIMKKKLPWVYDASRHVAWSQYLKQHCPCFRYKQNFNLCVDEKMSFTPGLLMLYVVDDMIGNLWKLWFKILYLHWKIC